MKGLEVFDCCFLGYWLFLVKPVHNMKPVSHEGLDSSRMMAHEKVWKFLANPLM